MLERCIHRIPARGGNSSLPAGRELWGRLADAPPANTPRAGLTTLPLTPNTSKCPPAGGVRGEKSPPPPLPTLGGAPQPQVCRERAAGAEVGRRLRAEGRGGVAGGGGAGPGYGGGGARGRAHAACGGRDTACGATACGGRGPGATACGGGGRARGRVQVRACAPPCDSRRQSQPSKVKNPKATFKSRLRTILVAVPHNIDELIPALRGLLPLGGPVQDPVHTSTRTFCGSHGNHSTASNLL
jgi:hypothetical protein